MDRSEIKKGLIGATTFRASAYNSEQYGSNGLPLTPNSIRILGRFQLLKSFKYPHLCEYLDLVRSKHEQVIIVAEHYPYRNSLAYLIESKQINISLINQVMLGTLKALSYLNNKQICHQNLSPDVIFCTAQGVIKLAHYGLHYMTEGGSTVSFPIGQPMYMAPESIVKGFKGNCQVSTDRLDSDEISDKTDIWSLGVITIQMVLTLIQAKPLWHDLTLEQKIRKILSYAVKEVNVTELIFQEHNATEQLEVLPSHLVSILNKCLLVLPSLRSSAKNLLQHEWFSQSHGFKEHHNTCLFSTDIRSKNCELSVDPQPSGDVLSQRNVDQLYSLWKLCGTDLDLLLRKDGVINRQPPVTSLAVLISHDGELCGEDNRSSLYNNTVISLSEDQLRQRLVDIEPSALYPLLKENSASNTVTTINSTDFVDNVKLPLVIRENNVGYQFNRMILFDRLITAYPYTRQLLVKEARTDIPPFYRAYVWAAILNIEGDVNQRYETIDKISWTKTDRQIELDIPRCHQYNELLCSMVAHAKFKRILKAWVVSHLQYVYWQGLDSLTVPFLYLNFNNEALAFACLEAFIDKYLYNFFLHDNSAVIKEYLAVFSHLLSFHDPILANHLEEIGFIPDLYAIPWFLTMFSHVFPLHKIFHLWDTLLQGNSSFPLYIGVAIMLQLRDQLLSFGFNECILIFSDMPEIDMKRCVQDSIRLFCSTPESATYRQYGYSSCQSLDHQKIFSQSERDELGMEPISIIDLKTEKFPRISARDLIILGGMNSSDSSADVLRDSRSLKPKIVVIDIRNSDEYKRGTLPDSINIPHRSAFNSSGELLPCPAVNQLNSNRNLIKVILGNREQTSSQFAHELIRLGYSKVCVLHKGIDILRTTSLLVIPSPEL